ncbi:hypothetical protein BKA63DRAFT_41404 [Paraphoma chrysanthemicola]|nr:hypothetical protein BKA63DRAFT_41404 [Paraphoma chrysanthemicola]
MPSSTTPRNTILVLCLSALSVFWFLGLFHAHPMDSIPSSFAISINGKPITQIDTSAADHTQAKVGKDAAIFTLQDSVLRSGDWIMGRDLTENRSFGPKQVSWYRASAESEGRVQRVTAKKESGAYQLIFTKGTLIAGDDDLVFVDLLGEAPSEVKVILHKT